MGPDGGVASSLCPGGPVCVWFWSPTPFPGLVGGACTGAAGAEGFDFGFDRVGAGAGGGETVVSRLGGGLGAWFVAQWLGGEPMRLRPLMLFAAGMVLLGIQFILMGLLGEMIAHLGAGAAYPVRRRYNLDPEG